MIDPPSRKQNYSLLPLEMPKSQALKTYGKRFLIILSIYLFCLIILLAAVNFEQIKQGFSSVFNVLLIICFVLCVSKFINDLLNEVAESYQFQTRVRKSSNYAYLDNSGPSQVSPRRNTGPLRSIEKADQILISKNTIQFGTSAYQFVNVTGFSVGKIPREKFPASQFMFFFISGVFVSPFAFFVGFPLQLVAAILAFRYLSQKQLYGIVIYLNSGHEKIFVNTDKTFLSDVVRMLHEFMEDENQGRLLINMSNRSVIFDNKTHEREISKENLDMDN